MRDTPLPVPDSLRERVMQEINIAAGLLMASIRQVQKDH
jgi:hypothetical protein